MLAPSLHRSLAPSQRPQAVHACHQSSVLCNNSAAPSSVLPTKPLVRHAHLSIPAEVLLGVQAANTAWAQHAVQQPLKEPGVNASVHLVGVANYGPQQEQVVSAALSQLQPDLVALELPLRVKAGQAGSAMLPYPAFVQVLMDHISWLQQPNIPGATAAPDSTAHERRHQGICAELSAIGAEAHTSHGIGHDIFDPFEATGYFAGAELAVRPQQISQAAELFDFLPGLEYATAAAWALDKELQLLCMDASLSLQQAWVSKLINRFELTEADLPRQLQAEYRAALEVVPEEHMNWDQQLGSKLSQLATEGVHEDSEASSSNSTASSDNSCNSSSSSSSSSSSNGGGNSEGSSSNGVGNNEGSSSGDGASNNEGGGSHGSSSNASGKADALASSGGNGRSKDGSVSSSGRDFGPTHAMTAYKVCKATAAAMLSPEATQQAVQRQAVLQPLKFAHFERRALHMASQLLEYSRRWQQLDSSASGTSTSNDNTEDAGLANRAFEPCSSSQPYIVAAVVGRQYVPMIQRLWNDPSSELWRGDVPRTFAPSMIEPALGNIDPDVENGGSRPVGHVAKVFGADGKQQQ